MDKKKAGKVTVTTRKVKGKAVFVSVESKPVAEVIKLSTAGKRPKTVYLTADATKPTAEQTVRVHRTEEKAVRRFHRRFPEITPRLRKLL